MENAGEKLKLGCVVMAAGSASRFGSNKLHAAVDGRSLILRALDAVPAGACEQVVVVTQYDDIASLAKEFSFTAIWNSHPEYGVSNTIRLGLAALSDCGGVLFQVADQPLLRRESTAALVRFFREHPEQIVALGHGGVRGNPCIFPARFFPELLALRGDCGGSAVIRAHSEALLLYEVSARELMDADTPEAISAIRTSAAASRSPESAREK